MDVRDFLMFAHGEGARAFDLDPAALLVGGLGRVAEGACDAAPSLLIGLLIAGALRSMVAPSAVRALFGQGRWSGPLRAWGLGLLLPISSLGALPIARELHRMGVARGTVLGFLLSASVLGPLSLVFGLSMLDPRLLAIFVAGSFAVSLLAGGLCHSGPSEAAPVEEGPPATGPRRLAAGAIHASRDLTGATSRDLALTALGVALLGAMLPFGWLEGAVSPERPAGPLVMGTLAVPAFLTPLEAMRQAGVLLRDGYSPAVALALLFAGAGLNLGALVWISSLVGRRDAMRLVPWLLGLVLSLGFASNALVPGGPRGGSHHTHALDQFGRPATSGGLSERTTLALSSLSTSADPSERLALGSLAVLAITGLAFRRPGLSGRATRWLGASGPPRGGPGAPLWERSVSKGWLLAVGTSGAITALVVLLLVHYPAPEETFAEMRAVEAEVHDAVRNGPRDQALAQIGRWLDLTGDLGPGVLLHRARRDKALGDRAAELTYSLETLREYVREGRDAEARTALDFVGDAYRACRSAHLGP